MDACTKTEKEQENIASVTQESSKRFGTNFLENYRQNLKYRKDFSA